MNTSETFKEFLSNLVITNRDDIYTKYKTITKALNKDFWESESEFDNSLQIGSYGRKTAINGVSDLDMIFELSQEDYKYYNEKEKNGQLVLLQDVKASILKSYPTTDIKVDRYVVVVNFSNHKFEVCPVFIQADGRYKFPDSYNGGKWKYINPRSEINEINDFDKTTNQNLKNLSKITRAWKNKCGVKIGGLLIDTLCYEFLQNNENHWETNYSGYDLLVRDYFEFLKNYDKERKQWNAPGSKQVVYKKGSNFISKAKKAHENILEAIEKKENDSVYSIWKRIFGYPFPYPKAIKESSINYTSQEQYIEEMYPVDITDSLSINCEVVQDGYRIAFLREMLDKLKVNKKLYFFIQHTDVVKPYEVKWKIKNEGQIAKNKNMLRGQIINDNGSEKRKEDTNFEGAHYVECYIIKNNICVARDRIDVPISQI
jgi:hypothetical protein